MTRFTSPPLRAFSIALVLGVGVCGWAAASSAQTSAAPAPTNDTLRLSDEQRSAILDSNTPESAAAARGELTGADRRVHGEVGVMIGTNGARGIYGVAEIPLGANGSAVVSYENTQYGNGRRARR